MDSPICNGFHNADSKSCNDSQIGVLNGENGLVEPGILTKMLIRLDLDLAYSYDKLENLDLCMTLLSLGENGFGELSEKSNISEVATEKALINDLLFCYLDSEVTELVHFLNVLQTKILDARQQIYSCRQREMCDTLLEKLRGSESSWKHLMQKVLEMKLQSENLHKTDSISGLKSTAGYSLADESLKSSGFDLQTTNKLKFNLRMLETYMPVEQLLDKQLIESKQREEELKLKLGLGNEVISDMQECAEVALKRLLEAEHSSCIYMWTAREMMSQLQILQFNLNCSVQREEELKSKLQISLEQLQDKETALQEIERSYAQVKRRCNDRETLEEKIKLLEEKLQLSESKLQEAIDSYEASQEQLCVMENAIESLREHVLSSEIRAQNAETKLTTLTEENMELKEEVGFLKGGDGNEGKISLLEKQVRDFEAQLRTAKSASEASIKQQNMLYSAIWDMETLIEELKSKVSKSESRAENAEEQCLVLAETNLELTKEISNHKSVNEKLEVKLKEAGREKVAWEKNFSSGAKAITDMVMQLATERDRIQKQYSSLVRENKILLEELKRVRNGNNVKKDNKEDYGKQFRFNEHNLPNKASRGPSSVEEIDETPESATASNQVDEPSEQNLIDEVDAASSSSPVEPVPDVDSPNKENQGKERRNQLHKFYLFAAIFVLMLSVLAVKINWQDIIVLRQ